MATPEQLERIRKRLAEGASKEQIREELQSNAWSEADIEAAFASLDPKVETPSPHSGASSESSSPTSNDPDHWRVKRGLLRTYGFAILSFLYPAYWFYVHRKLISREMGIKTKNTWHVIGNQIPIISTFTSYWLLRDLAAMREKAGLPVGFSPILYTVLLFVSMLLPAIIAIWFLLFLASFPTNGDPFGIPTLVILLVSLMLLLFVYGKTIRSLNEYWEKRSGGVASEAPVTRGEILVLLGPIVIQIVTFALLPLLLAALTQNKADETQEKSERVREQQEQSAPSPSPTPNLLENPDNDGLTGRQEQRYGTDPEVSDTDEDGFEDGDEVKRGFNPNGSGKLQNNAVQES